MYIIRNDGFELGARRRPLPGISDCNKFLMEYDTSKELRIVNEPDSVDVDFNKVKNKGYNLFPFEYMEHTPIILCEKPLIKLGHYVKERNETFVYDDFKDKDQECVVLSVTQNGIYIGEVYTVEEMNNLTQKYKRVYPNDFAYNPHRINVGSIGIVPNLAKYMYVSNIYPVFYLTKSNEIPKYYLLRLLKSKEYKTIINDYCLGGARADLKYEWLSKIKIPIPPLGEIETIEALSNQLEDTYQKYLDLYNQIMLRN